MSSLHTRRIINCYSCTSVQSVLLAFTCIVQDDYFKPVEVPCKIDVLEHECLTKKEIAISCLDEDGKN